MRFAGHGHPAVRATHDKTLELSTDAGITERATCIVSVATTVDDPRPLAGPVRLTLRTSAGSWSLDAVANPGWDPAAGAVVRRSAVRTPGTFATEATATAADIPRALLTSLADAAATVEVDVERLPSPPTVVLAVPHAGPDPALAAEISAADVVVAEDPTAARLVGERVASGPVTVTGRVVVVACEALPGATVADRPAGTRVETHHLPRALAAALAVPGHGPVLLAGGDLRAALLRAPAGARVVVPATADRVAALVDVATDTLGGVPLAVVAFADRPPVTVTAGQGLPGRDAVHLAVTASGELTDPVAIAVARALLGDGVATKSVARAVAAVTGGSQRAAYDAVLRLRER